MVILLILTLNHASNRSPELGLAPTCVKKILGINRYRILVAVRPLFLKLQRRHCAFRYIGCAMEVHIGTGFLVLLAFYSQC